MNPTPDLDAIVELRKAAATTNTAAFFEACWDFDFAALQSRLAVLEGALREEKLATDAAFEELHIRGFLLVPSGYSCSLISDAFIEAYHRQLALTPDPDSEERTFCLHGIPDGTSPAHASSDCDPGGSGGV